MKWIRYYREKNIYYGIADLQNKSVVEVQGNPFEDYETTNTVSFSDIKLLTPFDPKTFYAAGTNYEEHIRKVAELIGEKPNIPTQADIGYRANNALIAHEETIMIPKDATEKVQYEAELVVVIGKKAFQVKESEALNFVFGYSIGNDVSERSWQKSDRTLWRAKNSDTFKPMGPWIETEADLDDMTTSVHVNGVKTIEFKTNQMIFGVEKYIHEITKYITLYPGDMIWMGTDGEGKNLSDGDTCEITISGIGTLKNYVRKINS
tara:strand:+ start:793 stop:1581 length:789 start_codon:yes stop_codon:yes gene_type:complete